MIAAVLTLAQVASAPAPDVRAEEVVVIGRRLKEWRASWRSHDGNVTCVTTRSSGDSEVDAVGCAAIVQCAKPIEPRAIALAKDKSLDRAARKAANDALNGELGRCMMAKRTQLIDELADRRAAAREKAS